MPNINGYTEHPDNPAWISLSFDDGSQSPYAQDPDGSFRSEATQIAHKMNGQVPGAAAPSALAGNPLAMPAAAAAAAAPVAAPAPLAGNPLAMSAPTAQPTVQGAPESIARPGLDPSLLAPSPMRVLTPGELPPDQKVALDQEERHRQALLAAGISQQKVQQDREARAKADAAQARGAQPYQIVNAPPTGGGVSLSETFQSNGLSAADKKKVDAANQTAVETAYGANQSGLEARTNQLNAEWERLTEQEKSKLAEKAMRDRQEADFTAKVDAQSKKMQEITSRPIDPSKAFQGDAGWYSFMAVFGDSIQNFGAALAGRGPVANPGATVDRMIERSIAMQTAQQEQEFKAGRITADQLNADREYVRAQIATVGKQLSDTQLQKAQTKEEQMGLEAMGKKFAADRDAAIARNAAATARTQQYGKTMEVKPGTGGGPSIFLGEKPDWDAVKAHSEKEAGAEQVERGVGRLEKAAGWTWDEKANNGAGGYVGQDGKPVTANSADPAGVSVFGSRFSTGEGARELNGALEDMAAGGAKVKDPIGAVSDKSVAAEKDAMAASTDEGILRAAERTRRNLRGMRAGIDSGFSPGVVNASRYRRSAEQEYRNSQPGLPRSRAPGSAEELRGNP